MVEIELDRSAVQPSVRCIVMYGQYQFIANNDCRYKNDRTVRYFGIRFSGRKTRKLGFRNQLNRAQMDIKFT